MPIVQADIKFFKSTGAESLGGAITATEITDAVIANLFDNVDGDESESGDTEYRCFYIKNDHGSLTYQGVLAFIETQTPSSDTSVEIGLGTSAVNGTEQTIANESTAPAGVTFTTADGVGNGLSIGDIPFGEHKAIWVKRIVNAAASAYNADGVVIKTRGSTGA